GGRALRRRRQPQHAALRARLPAPARSDGPCGAAPAPPALELRRRDGAPLPRRPAARARLRGNARVLLRLLAPRGGRLPPRRGVRRRVDRGQAAARAVRRRAGGGRGNPAAVRVPARGAPVSRRVFVAGLGSIGRRHLETLRALGCAATGGRLEEAERELPEAVVIATPTSEHAAGLDWAVRHG